MSVRRAERQGAPPPLWGDPATGRKAGVGQSRTMSLAESLANVLVGYGAAVTAQMLIFPVFGLQATLAQNLKIGAAFTLLSIARAFALRRLFETVRLRFAARDATG